MNLRRFITPTILILLLQNGVLQNNNKTLFIEFLVDFLSAQNFPVNTIAHFCWPAGDSINLAKMLSSKNMKVTLRPHQSKVTHPEKEQYTVFLIDMNCDDFCKILQQGELFQLMKKSVRWIVVGNYHTFRKCNIDLRIDTRLYLMEKTMFNKYKVTSVYSYEENSKNYTTQDIALWSKDGFSYFQDINLFENRRNLHGARINVIYKFEVQSSVDHIWDYRNKYSDGVLFTFAYIITHYSTELLNGTRNLTYANTWGTLSTPQNASGYVGSIVSGSADIAGGPFYLIANRVAWVDYITHVNPVYLKFILKPPPLSYVTNIFSLPFDNYVWYSLLLLTLVTIILVYAVAKWEWGDPTYKKKIEGSYDSMKDEVMESVMMQLSILSQQGSNFEMKSASGRIIMAFSLIAFMFLFTSYSANIVVLLQSTTTRINTLDDLLNSRIEVGIDNLSYVMQYFVAADVPVKRALYNQKIFPQGRKPNIMPLQQGVSKMRTEFFAFHSVVSNIYEEVYKTFEESEKCNLIGISYINELEPYIAARKNWSYTELVKIGFNRLREVGIFRREQHRLQSEKPRCTSAQSNFVSVGLSDTYFPFIFLVVSYLLCASMFIAEIGFKKYKGLHNIVEHTRK